MFMYCMIILYSMKYTGSNETIKGLWYDELDDESTEKYVKEHENIHLII